MQTPPDAPQRVPGQQQSARPAAGRRLGLHLASAQVAWLGATMAALDVVYELLLVHMVSRMRKRLATSRRVSLWLNRVCGTVLVALGVRLAMQQR